MGIPGNGGCSSSDIRERNGNLAQPTQIIQTEFETVCAKNLGCRSNPFAASIVRMAGTGRPTFLNERVADSPLAFLGIFGRSQSEGKLRWHNVGSLPSEGRGGHGM